MFGFYSSLLASPMVTYRSLQAFLLSGLPRVADQIDQHSATTESQWCSDRGIETTKPT